MDKETEFSTEETELDKETDFYSEESELDRETEVSVEESELNKDVRLLNKTLFLSGTFQHWPFQTLPEMEIKPSPLDILASLKRPSSDSPTKFVFCQL